MFADLAEKLSMWFRAFAKTVHLDLTLDTSLALLWVVAALIVSILVGQTVSTFVRLRFEKSEEDAARRAAALPPPPKPARLSFWNRLAVQALPLIAPVLNLFLALLGAAVLRELGYDHAFITDMRHLLLSWFFVTLVYVVTQSIGKTIFIALLLTPLSLPFVQPYVQESATILESLAFTIGKTEIHALMIVKLIVTAMLLLWLAGAIKNGVHASLGRMYHMQWSTRQLLQNLSTITIYALAILTCLSLLGIDLTAFAVLGGALGVGIGLGLQKIASNFISGLILLSEQSVQVNDMIEIAGSGITGLVRHTGARYTMLETIDQREVMIPNDDLITNRVINWTHTSAHGAVTIDVGVSYDSDLDMVREELIAAAAAHPATVDDPSPTCLLKAFGASSVDFTLIFYVTDIRERRQGIRSEVMFDIWRRFKTREIGIPYPQMTVHYAVPPVTAATGEDVAAAKKPL